MPDNAEGSIEERDPYDGGPGAEDTGGYGADPVREAAVAPGGADPDVFLDVPVLKVDQIDLDVEDLRAHVSLQAEVLDLLRLNVGADVLLGRVHLGISGVEAQAQLRVRLDNVATIINRVLTTLDRNPEILHELARGVGSAVRDVGGGARQAVSELGTGVGRTVEDIGRGAGVAVRDVGAGAGRAVQDVGRGVGSVAEDVGRGAGSAVRDVGAGAGRAVEDVGGGVGSVAEDVGGEAIRTVGKAGEAVGAAAGAVTENAVTENALAENALAENAAGVAEAVDGTVRKAGRAVEEVPAVPAVPDTAGGAAERAGPAGRDAARGSAQAARDRAARIRSGLRARRTASGGGRPRLRPGLRRIAEKRDDPP